jgi:hypothetical protein
MKRDKQAERTAPEIPSVLSIWTLAVLAGALLATSVWIALGPVEEFTLRAALGAGMGAYAGLMTGLHAVGRIHRRLAGEGPVWMGVDDSGDQVWRLPDGRWTWGDTPEAALAQTRTFTPDRYVMKYGEPDDEADSDGRG